MSAKQDSALKTTAMDCSFWNQLTELLVQGLTLYNAAVFSSQCATGINTGWFCDSLLLINKAYQKRNMRIKTIYAYRLAYILAILWNLKEIVYI